MMILENCGNYMKLGLEDQCDADGKPYFGGPNARINIEIDPNGNDVVGEQVVLGTEILLWFGPMFPDGMVTQGSKRIQIS